MKARTVRQRTAAPLRIWALVALALLLMVPALPAMGAAPADRGVDAAEHRSDNGKSKKAADDEAADAGADAPADEPAAEPEPQTGGDEGGGDATPPDDAPPPETSPDQGEDDGQAPPDGTPSEGDPATDEPSDGTANDGGGSSSEPPNDETGAEGDTGGGDDGESGGDVQQAAPDADGTASASDARVAAPKAGAGGAGKNRGAVKINAVNFQQFPRNDPHVGCVFDVNFFRYPAGTASVRFEAWPPTGPGVFLLGGNVPLGPEQAFGWVGGDTFDLGPALAAFVAHPVQGYHVKIFVETTNPKTIKHKVFWVKCAAPPGAVGDLLVTKAVEGDAPANPTFDYTVTGPNGYSETFTLPDGGVWEWSDDVPPGDYVVTETDTFGADTTFVSVNGGEPVEDVTATGTVPDGGSAQVDFVNDFGVLPVAGANGELVVTKEVEGDDAPADPEFEFTVTGPNGYSETFTLPTAADEWSWTDEVPPGEYEVTESSWTGDPVTFVSVDGGPGSESTVALADVLENETTTVDFVNTYGNTIVLDRPPIEAPDPPQPGDPDPGDPDPPELPATGLGVVLGLQVAMLALTAGTVALRVSRKRKRPTPWLQA